MIRNFLLLCSHSKNIRMAALFAIIITYYLLIIIIIIITKSHNNYCSVGVIELCLLNLLILIDCFLSTSYPCVLFESLPNVINQESHAYSWNLGKIYLVHFLKFWKVNSVNLSQIFLLNMWLLGQNITYKNGTLLSSTERSNICIWSRIFVFW